jgi:hypothetical protein
MISGVPKLKALSECVLAAARSSAAYLESSGGNSAVFSSFWIDRTNWQPANDQWGRSEEFSAFRGVFILARYSFCFLPQGYFK